MSVRVFPWSKRGKSGFEIDIRITWPEGGKDRVRLKSPVTGREASKRWGIAREVAILREGKANFTKTSEPPPDGSGNDGPSNETACAPKSTKKKTATLAEFAPRFLREFAAANGQHQAGIDAKESILRLHLVPHLGPKPLDEILTADVQRLKAIYREGIPGKVKPTNEAKTINNRLTVLNKLLKVACEWGEIPSMPCTIRLLKVAEGEALFYEQAVLDRIYEAAAKVGTDAYVMALLGGDAGLRRGEMLGLNKTDIDYKRRQILVQRHVYKGKEGPPKNGKPRYVPMTQRLMSALRAHGHLRGERVLYFCEVASGRWRPLTPKVARMMAIKIEKAAGLPVTGRLHVLRHTFCSRLAMANAPVRTIQELAGHQSLTTTLRYMHLAHGAKHQAIELLDKRANVVTTEAEATAEG
jgi:integrase